MQEDHRPPESEPVELSIEEAERLLLTQLQDKPQNRKPASKQLAYLYTDTPRHDLPLNCLRELLGLETDHELKTNPVLTRATGG